MHSANLRPSDPAHITFLEPGLVSHRWAHTIFHIRLWVLWLGTLPGLWTWWLVCLGGANASDGQNAEPRCPWSITELLQLHTYYSNQECSNELSVPFACPILKSIRDFQSGRGETHSLILHMNHFMLWLHSICIHMHTYSTHIRTRLPTHKIWCLRGKPVVSVKIQGLPLESSTKSSTACVWNYCTNVSS